MRHRINRRCPWVAVGYSVILEQDRTLKRRPWLAGPPGPLQFVFVLSGRVSYRNPSWIGLTRVAARTPDATRFAGNAPVSPALLSGVGGGSGQYGMEMRSGQGNFQPQGQGQMPSMGELSQMRNVSNSNQGQVSIEQRIRLLSA